MYQLHAVTTLDELDADMSKNGASEAVLEAQEEGLTKYNGITSHGWKPPGLLLEALNPFPFDSALLPINPNFFSNANYKAKTEELLSRCKDEDVGTMIIKVIAKGAWGEREKNYTTWYGPFDTPEEIQNGIDFALSQDVTGICTAADINLLPIVVEACEKFTPMNLETQAALIEDSCKQMPIFEVEDT
ncbi:MAG: hypothetical protein GTO14_03390 [Anaerolineales bacterium]|nr:hypothetical protein [Anaerolineales bacterium]